ncbi:MAG TPA: nicotinate (nicotinamide) nucleotide adenylyltransferase [Thermoanaerobaculia bacterium]|jgi:nicotinate-nucleotide adenylyltransferase
MRIGVYGGSFDPVHFGHLVPVDEARQRLSLDEILFVPAFQPPHKPTGQSAPSHHRFAMLALALEAYPAFRLTDFEVARGGTTYTIETLRHLRAARADAEFVLVLGSDSLAGITTWRSWQEILGEFPIAVVEREGFPVGVLARELPQAISGRFGETILFAGNAPVTISSTWLRRAIPAGEDLSGSLPANVAAYLRRHALYRVP